MPNSTIYSIAAEFDKAVLDLNFLLQNDKMSIEREMKQAKAPECHEAVLKLHDAMSRVDQEVKALRANMSNNISAVALESKFYEILARKNRSESMIVPHPSTPVKQYDAVVTAKTPEEAKKMDVDFVEYPSTPTLDQIGLSGRAMALVGRGQDDYSNSVSDSEFDASFFQKSPGVFKSSANDSFSSIGSVPNFHVLNSSPSSQVPSGPHNLTQVTCAYDSGTDENSFNGINNSFMITEESGKVKNNTSTIGVSSNSSTLQK